MSKRNEATPQDARKRRIAEALRRNLKRRKLQARGRAVARSERAASASPAKQDC